MSDHASDIPPLCAGHAEAWLCERPNLPKSVVGECWLCQIQNLQSSVNELESLLAHKDETATTFMNQVKKLKAQVAELEAENKLLRRAVDDFKQESK